jgi:hypothetical protein
MKEVIEMPRLGKKGLCIRRQEGDDGRSFIIHLNHFTSLRVDLYWERRFEARHGHGLMSEVGRASCTTELVLTVLRIVRREPMKGRNS